MPIIYHTSHTDNHTLNNSWHTYLFESEVKLVMILYVSNLQAALLSNVCIKLKLVQEFLTYLFLYFFIRGFKNQRFSKHAVFSLAHRKPADILLAQKLKVFQTQGFGNSRFLKNCRFFRNSRFFKTSG